MKPSEQETVIRNTVYLRLHTEEGNHHCSLIPFAANRAPKALNNLPFYPRQPGILT